eukprot:743899-Alexandrium_andersonii.AAC.1
MPLPAAPAPRSGPAVPLVPHGTVLSEAQCEEVVAKAQEAMTYAAQSEMTPMVHAQQTVDLLSARSKLSVPEPTPDQEMEDSD